MVQLLGFALNSLHENQTRLLNFKARIISCDHSRNLHWCKAFLTPLLVLGDGWGEVARCASKVILRVQAPPLRCGSSPIYSRFRVNFSLERIRERDAALSHFLAVCRQTETGYWRCRHQCEGSFLSRKRKSRAVRIVGSRYRRISRSRRAPLPADSELEQLRRTGTLPATVQTAASRGGRHLYSHKSANIRL